MNLLRAASAFALVIALSTPALADDWFTDDFNDGVVDPAHWTCGGAVTETGGVLDLLRQEPADNVCAIPLYSGDWICELDSRLNYIVWNDMFHGLSIRAQNGLGISFGYSQYGKLYMGIHDANGYTAFAYGAAGSNQPGVWQHWVLTRHGGTITVTVDGQTFPATAPAADGMQVSMPGFYEDGDGGAHVGYTDSSVDNFSIHASTSGMETPAFKASSWGRIKETFGR